MDDIARNSGNGSVPISGRGLPHRKLSLEERIGMAADLALRQCHIEPSKTQAAQLLGVTVQQLRSELKARARREAQAQEIQPHEAEVADLDSAVRWWLRAPDAERVAFVQCVGIDPVWRAIEQA
jgi:hypothetical protein